MVNQPPLVAYTGVLIRTRRGRLEVTGSDGITTITSMTSTPGCEEGEVLVTPKPIAGWLQKVGATETIVASTDDVGDLCLTVTGGSPYRFRPLAATFPSPQLSAAGLADVELDDLTRAVAAVRHASDGTVQVVSNDDDLILSTTDNYRLAQARIVGAGFGERDGVVPLGPLEELARHDVTAMMIDSRSRELRARAPSIHVATRLIDGPFHAVDSVIAARPTTSVTLPVDDLRDALDRLAFVAERTPLTLRIVPGKLELSVSNADIGAGSETVRIEGPTPGEFECRVKLSFLADAVAAHDTDTVTFSWTSALAALYLSSDGPVTVTAVVMPVRG